MAITSSNGLVQDSTIIYSIPKGSVLYLYVDYVPGSETSCTLNFSVKDSNNANTNYFYLVTNGEVSIEKHVIVLPKLIRRSIIPVAVPESSDTLKIEVIFAGAEPYGSVDIFLNNDNHMR